MEKRGKLIIAEILFLVLTIPLILAQFGWSYGYYNSPIAFLDNEWVRFIIIFLLLFAVIYFAVNKTFKNNGISMVVAVALSFLISIALGQRGMLYSYAGDTIGDLAIVFGFLIAMFAVFKVLMENFGGGKGFIIGIISTIVLMSFVDLTTVLPSRYLYGPFGDLLSNITNILSAFIPILIPVGIIIFLMIIFKRRHDLQRGIREQTRALGKHHW